jgi:hypothetical protein
VKRSEILQIFAYFDNLKKDGKLWYVNLFRAKPALTTIKKFIELSKVVNFLDENIWKNPLIFVWNENPHENFQIFSALKSIPGF